MSGIPPFVRVVQTSIACPSQWDAWDAEGRYHYLRYRSGYGSVHHYPGGPGFWDRRDEEGQFLADFEHGDNLDGYVELAEFLELAGCALAPDAEVKSFNAFLGEQLSEAFSESCEDCDCTDANQ